MAELSLQNVFGASATQSATTFTVTKAEMAALVTAAGFTYTPTANDGAEKLFSALLFAASANLNSTQRAIDLVGRNIEIIAPSYPTIVSSSGVNYQRDGWTVNLYLPYTYSPLSANNY
jgi:hypothetical protein